MLGVPGTGPYSRIRTLSDAIRLNKQHLENAPLSKTKKKKLQEEIEENEAELKKVRKELRESKAKKPKE